MSDINLMIKVTRQQQISIEEYCINAGLSMSEHLTKLHDDFLAAKEEMETILRQIPKETRKETELAESPKRKRSGK